METWQNDSIDEVMALICQDEYSDMTLMLEEGESYYYGKYDDNGRRNGIGVGVYVVHNKGIGWEKRLPFYYIGEWNAGVREGKGSWVYSINEVGKGNFECNWINDFPEGDFTAYDWDDKSVYSSTKGNVRQGLYHGTVDEICTYPDGRIGMWTETYDYGYVNILYVKEPNDSNDIWVYVTGESNWYTSDGEFKDSDVITTGEVGKDSIHGIPGFGELW